MTIKEIIDASGMSQDKFSKEYGIPLRTLNAWATGYREPAPYIPQLLERLIAAETELKNK